MPFRQVIHELEAKLTSKTGGLLSKPSGKLERKSYKDNGERLKVTLRNLDVPDSATAVVAADGLEIARFSINGGSGSMDAESKDGGAMPTLVEGQTIEVRVNGTLVLTGQLYED